MSDLPLILVVDDDPVTTGLLVKVLSRYQYQVIAANHPHEGLDLFRKRQPRLIILDVNMPEMDGFEFCQNIRAGKINQCIPIMMLTDKGDEQAIEKAFDSGATDFLSKPINWKLLHHRLRFALRTYDTDESLRHTQQKLMYAQQLARLGYWEWDIHQDLITGSEDIYALFGHDAQDTLHRNGFLHYLHPNSRKQLDEALNHLAQNNDQLSLVVEIDHPNGQEIVLNIIGDAVRDEHGQLTRLTGSVQDITHINKAEATIAHLNLHDKLTDLPNRTFFMEMLVRALQKLKDTSYLAVITLDIDRFKLFNQSLGILGGDHLLKQLANRLTQITREGNVIARLGSDEFAVLLDMHPSDSIEAIAARYYSSLASAFMINDVEVFITPSMGVALAPLDASDAESLLACAHSAKTRAKKAGGNQYQFYTASMNQQAAKRLKLEHDLRRAIELNQLRVFYQPKIATKGLKLIGAEALVRWQHPEWGLVRPDEFIPVAEETGIILDIGQWVLNESCRQVAIWQKAVPDFHIGVNLSARQFLQDDLLDQVKQALNASGIPAKTLDLEITESLAMSDAERNIAILRELKSLNIHLSIDDFGTGYSSLSYLQAFPVDTIKIDRSFIMRIGTEQGSKADECIAAAIIAMAKSLNMTLVAEGVENEAQVQFLDQQGCEVLQGFYFGRPVPAEELEQKFTLLTNNG
jgi:diguanylate cyclase (GGDEF)-like protein/PAS domain S-box-containing protein